MGTKNDKDENEQKLVQTFMTLFPVVNLMALAVNVKWSLNEFRKNNYLIGSLAISLMWFCMGMGYVGDTYMITKLAGFW